MYPLYDCILIEEQTRNLFLKLLLKFGCLREKINVTVKFTENFVEKRITEEKLKFSGIFLYFLHIFLIMKNSIYRVFFFIIQLQKIKSVNFKCIGKQNGEYSFISILYVLSKHILDSIQTFSLLWRQSTLIDSNPFGSNQSES